MSDFENAIKEVMPSAMREVYLEPPDVPWSDIGGLDDIKRELQEAVEWPMRFPDMYRQLGHSIPKGILLARSIRHGQDTDCKSDSNRIRGQFH